jgi:DNA-binding MarR family transcriptional regulator
MSRHRADVPAVPSPAEVDWSALELQGIETIRGWQTDQDLFDEAVALYLGQNRTDMRCIDLIERAGRMTAGQLGAAARLSSGATTAALDRLERAGLVRRVRDDADRRRVLVEVTPRVEEVTGPVFAPFVEEGRALAERYTADEWMVILRFMRDDRALLQKHTDRIHRLIEERGTGAGG